MRLGIAVTLGKTLRLRQARRPNAPASMVQRLVENLLPAAILLLLIEAGVLPGVARSEPGDIIIQRKVPARVAERAPLTPSPDVVSVNPSPNRMIQGMLNGNSPSSSVQRELGDGEIAAIVTGAVGINRSNAGRGTSLVTPGALGSTGVGGSVTGAVLPTSGGGSPVGNVGGMVNSAVGDAMRGAGLIK